MCTHVKLRDLNTSVPVLDDRLMEGPRIRSDDARRRTIGSRHHLQHQLSRRSMQLVPTASTVNGAVDITLEIRCHVVVGLETGGQWSVEALNFIECPASGRAREATPLLRRSSLLGTRRRWTRMLSISCSRAFGGSLISTQADALEGVEGAVLDLADLFGQFSLRCGHVWPIWPDM